MRVMRAELVCRKAPSLLSFYSYTLYFHGVMMGPFVPYAEYVRFVEDPALDRLVRTPQVTRDLYVRTY